jgi:hypothetical protein
MMMGDSISKGNGCLSPEPLRQQVRIELLLGDDSQRNDIASAQVNPAPTLGRRLRGGLPPVALTVGAPVLTAWRR